MINWLKLILTFFQNSYDNIVTIFENQLKSTTKTAVLFLCIGILVTLLFTYYPVYSKIDHNNECYTQLQALQQELIQLQRQAHESYHKGLKDGEIKGEENLMRVNQIINNLIKSKQ